MDGIDKSSIRGQLNAMPLLKKDQTGKLGMFGRNTYQDALDAQLAWRIADGRRKNHPVVEDLLMVTPVGQLRQVARHTHCLGKALPESFRFTISEGFSTERSLGLSMQ